LIDIKKSKSNIKTVRFFSPQELELIRQDDFAKDVAWNAEEQYLAQ